MIGVAAYQLAPQVGDLTGNSARSLEAIRAAAELGARLIVLPELVTSGYVLGSREEAATVAITRDDELFAAWAAEAGRIRGVVVGGFCEATDDGTLYNSAAVVDGSGVLAVYRKLHLWDEEKSIFEPGAELPPVVETELGRIGVLICYDAQFPEITRSVALRGADVIAVPTNWSPPEWPAGERSAEVMAAMAGARANGVFMVCCDRVGHEHGIDFPGMSVVLGRTGWVLAECEGEGIAYAEIDPESARTKTRHLRNDAFGDRRPELYADVVSA